MRTAALLTVALLPWGAALAAATHTQVEIPFPSQPAPYTYWWKQVYSGVVDPTLKTPVARVAVPNAGQRKPVLVWYSGGDGRSTHAYPASYDQNWDGVVDWRDATTVPQLACSLGWAVVSLPLFIDPANTTSLAAAKQRIHAHPDIRQNDTTINLTAHLAMLTTIKGMHPEWDWTHAVVAGFSNGAHALGVLNRVSQFDAGNYGDLHGDEQVYDGASYRSWFTGFLYLEGGSCPTSNSFSTIGTLASEGRTALFVGGAFSLGTTFEQVLKYEAEQRGLAGATVIMPGAGHDMAIAAYQTIRGSTTPQVKWNVVPQVHAWLQTCATRTLSGLDGGRPLVTLSLVGAPVMPEGTVRALTLTRSGPTTKPFTVDLEWSGSSTDEVEHFAAVHAKAPSPGIDVSGRTRSVTFPAGVASVSVPLHALIDLRVEPHESLAVWLRSSPAYGRSGSVYLSIVPKPANLSLLTLSGPDVVGEGDALVVTARRNTPGPAISMPIMWGGTARLGRDYDATTGMLTIPAGATSGTASLMTRMSESFDQRELTATIAAMPSGYAITDASVSARLIEPRLECSAAPFIAPEGGIGMFTITRVGGGSATATIPLIWLGTASRGIDYLGAPDVVQFPAGVRSVEIPVSLVADHNAEGLERILCRLGTLPFPYDHGGSDSASLSISDSR